MSKIKVAAFASVAALAMSASPAFAATPLDLSATDYAKSTSTLNLAAGDYSVSYNAGGLYKAWKRNTSTDQYENRYGVSIGAGTVTQTGVGYPNLYSTPDAAFDAARNFTYNFSLAQASNVTFSIPDGQDSFGDNTGGVSLNVAAVPEPASWAMMLVGIGMMGATMRYRRRSTTAAYA